MVPIVMYVIQKMKL